MHSLNQTERAVMMHECKVNLGCDLFVVKKKRNNVSRKIHKQNSQGKPIEVNSTKSIKARYSTSFQAHAGKR